MSVLVFISSGMRSTAEIPDQRRSWSRYGGCEQGGGGALARKDEGGWRRRQNRSRGGEAVETYSTKRLSWSQRHWGFVKYGNHEGGVTGPARKRLIDCWATPSRRKVEAGRD